MFKVISFLGSSFRIHVKGIKRKSGGRRKNPPGWEKPGGFGGEIYCLEEVI